MNEILNLVDERVIELWPTIELDGIILVACYCKII